jgi:hypothetical protein
MHWYCPFCGTEMPLGYQPEDWTHCGEVGRAVPDDVPYPQFCRHPDICRGLSVCPRDPTCAD